MELWMALWFAQFTENPGSKLFVNKRVDTCSKITCATDVALGVRVQIPRTNHRAVGTLTVCVGELTSCYHCK